MDGRCSRRSCLCSQCLTLVPLSQQLPVRLSGWESPSTAPFPGQGRSSRLFFLEKTPPAPCIPKLQPRRCAPEPLEATPALEAPVLHTRAVFVHLAGIVLLSADF